LQWFNRQGRQERQGIHIFFILRIVRFWLFLIPVLPLLVSCDVGYGLCRDSKHKYYCGYRLEYDRNGTRVLDIIDVESFEVTNGYTLKDKFGCIQPEKGRKDCK
jgi:hypothetical protein